MGRKKTTWRVAWKRRKKNLKKNHTQQWKRLLQTLGVFLFFALSILGVAGIGFSAYLVKDLPSIDNLDVLLARTTTKIYDRTGTYLLYEYGDVKRTTIPLEQIPQTTQQAFIAIEDHEFYQHHGFSLRGIARAIWGLVIGQNTGGGSTITQQLVHNTLLSPERNIPRKIREIIVAILVENRYSKQEILERYLNAIPFGGMIYGIDTAAQYYFSKPVSELNLAESSFLAALPWAPTYLSPFRDNLVPTTEEILQQSSFAKKEKKGNETTYLVPAWKRRQAKVLFDMVKYGYIAQPEAEKALLASLKFNAPRANKSAPHFVDFVEQQLIDFFAAKFNYDVTSAENFVSQHSLKIITSLDWEKQKIAEEVLANHRERMQPFNASNACLVALDPKTGEIVAMVGSYDYWDESIDGQVNVTTSPNRQPGSAMKPLVYAYAFEKGYAPATMIGDVKTTFDTIPPYTPNNFDEKFHGPMFIREALANSYNIPVVKIILLLGVSETIDFFHRMGITTMERNNQYGPAVALGSGETKLLDLTYAYATLANQGRMVGKKALIPLDSALTNYRPYDPVSILKIEDSTGTVLDEYQLPAGKQVVSPGVAFLLWNVLSDYQARATMFGTNSALNLKIRKAAAKTGTTTDYKDITTFGYTTNLAVGLWAGNNDGSLMKPITGSGGTAPMWNEFMTRVLPSLPDEQYPLPTSEIQEVSVCKITGLLPGACPTVKEYFLKTNLPREKDTNWTKILIDKTSGKRAAPNCPAESVEEKYFLATAREQHEEWQPALDSWLAGAGGIFALPPENEFACTPPGMDASGISLSILEPGENQIIADKNVTTRVKVFSKLTIAGVNFYLDGQLIATKNGTVIKQENQSIITETFSTVLHNLSNGPHTLNIVALDETGNSNSALVHFAIATENFVTITAPAPHSILNTNSVQLAAQAYTTETISTIRYNLDQGTWSPLTGTNPYSTTLNAVSEGEHSLTVEVTTGTDKLSDTVSFSIDTLPPSISLTASVAASTVNLVASGSDNGSGVGSVIFYAGKSSGSKEITIAKVISAENNQYVTNWEPTESGMYYFIAEAIDKATNTKMSNTLSLTVTTNTPIPH